MNRDKSHDTTPLAGGRGRFKRGASDWLDAFKIRFLPFELREKRL
jgi:hypothetical protein